MIEHDDRRIWDIDGHEVTFLHVDRRFSFECVWAGQNRLSVVIETPFTLRLSDRIVICDPEDIHSLKDALFILHKPLASLTAFRDGRLLITFSDATALEVAKHPKYDSWQAHGEGELQDLDLLCSPHPAPPWGE